MSIAGQRDIDGLRAIGGIIGNTLEELRQSVAPGITTKDLDRMCESMLKKHHAHPAPMAAYGFPGQLCISVNDEVVHGIPGSHILHAGDLVKLDLEAEKDGYIADATITVAMPPIKKEQASLIACVEEAFWKATDVAHAGNRISAIGRQVAATVGRYGFSVVRELCGHGVGRYVHEEPDVLNYEMRGSKGVLADGLVITIEPIINAGLRYVEELDDGWTIRTADRSLSAHYEHTIIVRRGKPIIVTAV